MQFKSIIFAPNGADLYRMFLVLPWFVQRSKTTLSSEKPFCCEHRPTPRKGKGSGEIIEWLQICRMAGVNAVPTLLRCHIVSTKVKVRHCLVYSYGPQCLFTALTLGK